MGLYLVRVLDVNGRTWLDPALKPVERLIYRVAGIDPAKEQDWIGYAVSVLIFSIVTLLLTYLILRLQGVLPLNPQSFSGVAGGPGLQYRRQFHHQHQLAELHRRKYHVLSVANGGPRVA